MENTHVIKNYDSLATTAERKVVLSLIEEAFSAINPHNVMDTVFSLHDNTLTIADQTFDMSAYERVFLIGFGKGSSGIAKIMEEKLGHRLTDGWDIDVVDETFTRIADTKGTHPLPSETNINYTKQVLEKTQNLTEKDLVFVVICGGGSVMFEAPHKISLETLTAINKALLNSGATISEMNVLRKHLSSTKGGGLAKHLHPATVVSLIFSDVPGNDLSVIASGPTVKDPTTLEQVQEIRTKYKIDESVSLSPDDFTETPKDNETFSHVHNILVLSNQTALEAMKQHAESMGYKVTIYGNDLQGDARIMGEKLLSLSPNGQITLFGGETTVKVTGTGKGGRNQTLVVGALEHLDDKTTIASFDSDGWDFYELSGAIGDSNSRKKAEEMGLDSKSFLDNNDSFTFLEKIGDGIRTGKQESNVSDLMIVLRT